MPVASCPLRQPTADDRLPRPPGGRAGGRVRRWLLRHRRVFDTMDRSRHGQSYARASRQNKVLDDARPERPTCTARRQKDQTNQTPRARPRGGTVTRPSDGRRGRPDPYKKSGLEPSLILHSSFTCQRAASSSTTIELAVCSDNSIPVQSTKLPAERG